jgi:hypothetical protein
MWLRGAPQHRGARGTFRGADAHTLCYVMHSCAELRTHFLLGYLTWESSRAKFYRL